MGMVGMAQTESHWYSIGEMASLFDLSRQTLTADATPHNDTNQQIFCFIQTMVEF